MMMVDSVAVCLPMSLHSSVLLRHRKPHISHHGRNNNQRLLPLQRHPLHRQGPRQGRRPMPLQQLQKLQRFDLRSQLPDDEDDDRVSEGKGSREVVSGRCYEVRKGVGAVLLLEMCMFDGQI